MKNVRILSLLTLGLVLAGCGSTTPTPPPTPDPVTPPGVPGAVEACQDVPADLEALEVPAGAVCALFGTTIAGDVTVAAGARLEAISVQIGGSVRATGADTVSLDASSVTGDVLLSGGQNAELVSSRVEGSVRFLGNEASASVSEANVGGDLEVSQNTGPILIDGNSVTGNLVCEGNSAPPEGSENQVSGDKTGQCSDL